MSSPKEIIAYISSPTGMEGFEYDLHNSPIKLADLPFPNGQYTAHYFDLKSGPAGSRKRTIHDGRASFGAPIFIDDLAIHIIHPSYDQTQ